MRWAVVLLLLAAACGGGGGAPSITPAGTAVLHLNGMSATEASWRAYVHRVATLSDSTYKATCTNLSDNADGYAGNVLSSGLLEAIKKGGLAWPPEINQADGQQPATADVERAGSIAKEECASLRR